MNKKSLVIAALIPIALLTACGSSSDTGSPGSAGSSNVTDNGGSNGINGGASPANAGNTSEPTGAGSSANPFVGSWQFISTSEPYSILLTFNDDGTYQSDVVVFASSSLWQDQQERGTYATSDSTLTSTPTEWSCAGPDPIAMQAFSFADGNLTLSSATGVIVYPPRDKALAAVGGGGPPAAGVVIAIGCFGPNGGSFTQRGLAPVGN
ncbi:MAG: hypothetical protein WDO69_33205 [Pseudomonadota bacterium]